MILIMPMINCLYFFPHFEKSTDKMDYNILDSQTLLKI